MRNVKIYIGMVVMSFVTFCNVHILTDNSATERLIMLNDVEALAEEEPMGTDYGKELRSSLCESGTNYYHCVSIMDEKKYCLPSDETYCGAGDEKGDDTTTPGNENDSPYDPETENNSYSDSIITGHQYYCNNEGHSFVNSMCFKRCTNCGLTVYLCN